MPRFLSGQTNQCCCPEMRCCTPLTVTVTGSGFSGAPTGGWYIRKVVSGPFGQTEYDPDSLALNGPGASGPDDYFWTGGAGNCVDSKVGTLYNVMMRHDPYAGIYEAGAGTGVCVDYSWGCAYPEEWPIPEDQWPPNTIYSPSSIWPGVAMTIWPSIAFPPMYGQGGYNGNSAMLYRSDCWLPFYNDTPASYYERRSGEYVAQFLTDTAYMDQYGDVPKLLTKPTDEDYYFTGASGGITCESDYNGTYICNRLVVPLRPELEAIISRSASGQRNPVREPARIVFEVYCRRRWSTGPCQGGPYISGTPCTPVLDPPTSPPDGDWFCVDYRCERAAPWEATSACDYLFCKAPPGFAKPKLKAYHELGNDSASIRLVLEPAQYMSGQVQFNEGGFDGTMMLLDKARRPFSWGVSSVEIKNKGDGYEVGEFFIVSFDEYFLNTLDGGPIVVNLPNKDWACMGGGSPTWRDKYNWQGITTPLGVVQFQRLRVTSVDEGGGITGLEIVPWRRDPDFGEGCIELSLANRRDYFPQYTRALCHPTAVDLGGKGYLAGDTISFVCKHPSCTMLVQATAVVTDVDEEGAVQDWHISGSDLCNYGYCAGFENDCAFGYYDEPDERGAYKFDGTQLCTLDWYGVGVPVRRVGSIKRSLTTDSRIVNASGLTATSVNISRSQCRTGIDVLVSDWIFDLPLYKDAGKPDPNGNPYGTKHAQAAGLFPPFPKCWGGGAVITPIIGTDGANDSEIGGPLAGGIVVAGGTGYAYRDKRHVHPILEKNVPSIQGESGVGTGARLYDFSFSSVLNFPYPGYMAEALYADPQPDRFAYFPVTGATIDADHRGTGYEIGMEFDVAPVGGGQPFSDAWSDDGGDNPDVDVNGSYYGGARAKYLNANGHYDWPNGTFVARPSKARIRITSVNEDGGITGIEVIEAGMMFKPEWTVGRQHPDARIWVTSDTGEGAKVAMTVNTTYGSATFGQVTSVSVIQLPVGEASDPLYSTPGNPVAYPIGGRDYANPPSGLMWELQGASIGGWSIISTLDWNGMMPFNPKNPEKSSHDVIESNGTLPYIRRAERCHLGECPQPLLSKSYQLHTVIVGGPEIDSLYLGNRVSEYVPNGLTARSFLPIPAENECVPAGRPPYNYMLCRMKGFRTSEFDGDPSIPVAHAGAFCAVMWGPTATLGYSQPANCPDHLVGRTSP